MKHAAAFAYFADIIKRGSGITLGEDKLYLVETRLADMCREKSCKDISELHRKLGAIPSRDDTRQIIEAITTNETWWFRDNELFVALKTLIWPALLKRGISQIRMWCAASSTGQEPYTLKMTWEAAPLVNTKATLHLTGTDIDTKALQRCKEGIYSQLEIGRGLPTMELISHFDQHEGKWKIKENLKRNIEWKQLNLMEGPPAVGMYDIVLCRNVLIYFDAEGKERVLSNIARAMKPEGLLFVGGSESLFNVNTPLQRATIGKVFCYGGPKAVEFAKSIGSP